MFTLFEVEFGITKVLMIDRTIEYEIVLWMDTSAVNCNCSDNKNDTYSKKTKKHIIKSVIENLSVRHSHLNFNVFIKALRAILSLLGKVKIIPQYS